MSDLPQRSTPSDLENAKTKGQVIGWLQGFAVGVGGMILLGMLGWIPALLVVGVGGFFLSKAFGGSSAS